VPGRRGILLATRGSANQCQLYPKSLALPGAQYQTPQLGGFGAEPRVQVPSSQRSVTDHSLAGCTNSAAAHNRYLVNKDFKVIGWEQPARGRTAS
jgi:hypothetical protein